MFLRVGRFGYAQAEVELGGVRDGIHDIVAARPRQKDAIKKLKKIVPSARFHSPFSQWLDQMSYGTERKATPQKYMVRSCWGCGKVEDKEKASGQCFKCCPLCIELNL
jgi:hypothetical protein